MNETLFARAYLETCWAKDYEAYCASEADADLLNKLRNWADRAAQKETTAEKALIRLFFEDIWGYASAGMQAKGSGHNLYPQFPIDKAGQAGGVGKADLAIGWFGRDDVPPAPQVLCEFKDERSGLDDSQNRIANTDTNSLSRTKIRTQHFCW